MKHLALLLVGLLAPATIAFAQDAPPPPAQQEAPLPPDMARYQNLWVGMKFEYPKAWEITTDKRGSSRFLIPMEGTSDRAVLEITSVTFRSEPNVWQLSEAGLNKSLKRPVDRQWEEEILGVPLLLTQVTYKTHGSELRQLSGLIYTLGFNKMLFRLTAPIQNFDKAQYEWRKVLQSLRTWDGSMPKEEDPNVKIEAKDPKKDEVAHPTVPHAIGKTASVKAVVGPFMSTVTVGTAKLELHGPETWKAAPGSDGLLLTNAEVPGGVRLTFASATEVSPETAVLRASGNALADFASVAQRDENAPKANAAGAEVVQIWRRGASAKGPLFTCEAYGMKGDAYFILTWKSADASRYEAESKAIRALLDGLSLEAVK